MKKTMVLGIVLIVSILWLSCKSTSPQPPKHSQNNLSLIESSNQFGFKLFTEVIAKSDGGNVFISPLSVSMALGMTYKGSAGTTQEAMKTTLGFEGFSDQQINQGYRTLIDYLTLLDPKVKIEIANSIWYRKDLDVLQEFIDLNKTFFDAVVSALNFNDPGAADTINAWVNGKTHGKIDSIVDKPIDPTLVMFLINATYFKGDWTYQFDKSKTASGTFHTPAGDKTVSMMKLHGDKLPYLATDKFQAVDLPYGNGSFAMAIFVPKERHNIDELVSMLTPDNWATWSAGFVREEGDVSLPRFELEYNASLKKVLIALGMAIAFSDSQADFSRIHSDGGLSISDVKHKTYVKVDEEGTEAAAVTSVGIQFTSLAPPYFIFRVDRPFVIVLHDKKSKALLFMGKITDPI